MWFNLAIIRKTSSSSFSFTPSRFLNTCNTSCERTFSSDPTIILPSSSTWTSWLARLNHSTVTGSPCLLLLLISPETLILCLKSGTKRLTQHTALTRALCHCAGMWTTPWGHISGKVLVVELRASVMPPSSNSTVVGRFGKSGSESNWSCVLTNSCKIFWLFSWHQDEKSVSWEVD